MNPTDQARKEARKKELKKNKKQRQLVRTAVLKGKDPQALIVELEKLDAMEYDPNNPPILNEKVLKDKRRKVKETFDRVLRLYEREDPDMYVVLRRLEGDYNKKRNELITYCEAVKSAQRVQLEEIPLPVDSNALDLQASNAHLFPGDIPLPALQPHGILKKTSSIPGPPTGPVPQSVIEKAKKRRPPGAPPGMPPELSDYSTDDDDDEEEEDQVGEADETLMDDDDDEAYDPVKEYERLIEERQQATAMLLKQQNATKEDIGKENVNENTVTKGRTIRFADDDSWNPEDEEKDTRVKFKPAVGSLQAKMLKMAGQQVPMVPVDEEKISKEEILRPPGVDAVEGEIPGPPPGLPPGIPLPPMFNRPPPLRPGVAPRLLPPGPPPGRPAGMPPGPPPGLPTSMRPPPLRPPGLPLPRMMRPPPVLPPGIIPPHMMPPSTSNPNILSAPPSLISRPKQKEDESSATIEAKPQIRSSIQDVTRFTPTALKVKRDAKSTKKPQKPSALGLEETRGVTAVRQIPANVKTKDDAYDTFMKEMESFL